MGKSNKTYFVLPEDRTPDIWDKLMNLKLLRWLNPFFQKHRSVLMYLFFGAVTTVVSWVTFWLFAVVLQWNELVANLVSWIITVLVAFLTNRVWVFNAPTKGAAAYIKQLLSFYGSRVATFLVETALIYVFVTRLGFYEMAVKIAASIIVVILNYVFSKLFVFAKKKAPKN